MDYDALNSRLSRLADSYGRANRTGLDFSRLLAATPAAAIPAAAAVQRLSQAVFGHSEDERKGVESLMERLGKLQGEERRSMVIQRNLSRRLEAMEAAQDVLGSEVEKARARKKRLEALQSLTAGQAEELKRLRAEIAAGVQTLDRGGAKLAEGDAMLARSLKGQAAARQEFQRSAESVLDVSKALAGASRTVSSAVSATGMRLAVDQSLSFNRTLIEANSSLGSRRALWAGALEVQAKTGDSLEDIVGYMKALRTQTQLYRPDWEQIAVTASKLHQGLGASTDEISTLLNASRSMRVSFQDLADSIARIVDQTSLSVHDVVGMAQELRTVLLQYNAQTTGGKADATLRQLSALEQTMREQGASEGGALRVLKQFSDMRQRGGQGLVLGSGGPDFLSDASRTQRVYTNLAAMLRPFKDNALIFSQIAEKWGLAADDAQALIRSTDLVAQTERQLAGQRKTLDERFQEQSAASGKVYAQLSNNLRALFLQGLSPVTSAVAVFNEWLSKLRESVDSVRSYTPDWVKTGLKFTIAGGALVAVGAASVKAVAGLLLVRQALLAVAAQGVAGGVAGAGRGALLAVAPSIGRQAAQAAGRALPTVVAGARGVAAAGRGAVASATTRSLASGAATLLRGLLPVIISALPVLVPVAIAAVAAFYLKNRWEEKAKQLQIDMALMRNTRSVVDNRASLTAFATKALDVQSGTQAAQQVLAGLPAQRQALLDGFRKGNWASDTKAFEGAIKAAKLRDQAQLAQIDREAPTATVERRDEMRRGHEALIAAIQRLEDTQREVAAEQVRINKEARAKEEATRSRERLQNGVRSVTSESLIDRLDRAVSPF